MEDFQKAIDFKKWILFEMDQKEQKKIDLPWEDLNKNGKIIEDDIIEKIKRIGEFAYPHQFEFLQYMLG